MTNGVRVIRFSFLSSDINEFLGKVQSRPFLTWTFSIGILSALYFSVIASPIYVSSASFSVRGGEAQVDSSLLADFVGNGASSSNDALAAIEYMRSLEMAVILDQELGLRDIYSAWRVDVLNRLSRRATDEEFLYFYQDMTRVYLDRESKIITLEVRSFDPESAEKIATTILEKTGDFIDRISDNIEAETLSFREEEAKLAKQDVLKARVALQKFRSRTGSLDPIQLGAGKLTAVLELEAETSRLRSELAAESTISRSNSPKIEFLSARINSLEEQIAKQKEELVIDSGKSNSIAELLTQYESLLVEKEYADQRLVVALSALDVARSGVEEKHRFIVEIIHPNLPDSAVLPRRLLDFLFIMLVAIVLYGIAFFGVQAISDHRGH